LVTSVVGTKWPIQYVRSTVATWGKLDISRKPNSVEDDPGRVKTQSVLWFPLLNRGGMMRGFVQGADRQQTTLLPECLNDWVGGSNPVRAVDVFVDALELRDLGA
jgi:hypothetical protein